MHERDAFVRAIAENPYDDTARLAFADWLDEHGDQNRAGFIRLQCELEPIRDRYEIPRAAELHQREDLLLWQYQNEWLGAMPRGWDDWQAGITLMFRRGFPDVLALPASPFLEFGEAIRNLHPTIRRVVLFRMNGYGGLVADCPALKGLAELELACWYPDSDARALARSPHLGELQVLELWLGHHGTGLPAVRQVRVFGGSKAWPKLRELSLINPDNGEERARKRLIVTANKAAGREVAVYRRGFPGLFPFAADFFYTFPGHLPDGRMAMAAEDRQTKPPSLCVITFDKRGKQAKGFIRVPLPDEVLVVPPGEWYKHKGRIVQQLAEVLGFEPGFIRVSDCRFGASDPHGYNRPHPDIPIEMLGRADENSEEAWENNPNPGGNGGRIWRAVRNGEYVFGWDRYADKRGRVHST